MSTAAARRPTLDVPREGWPTTHRTRRQRKIRYPNLRDVAGALATGFWGSQGSWSPPVGRIGRVAALNLQRASDFPEARRDPPDFPKNARSQVCRVTLYQEFGDADNCLSRRDGCCRYRKVAARRVIFLTQMSGPDADNSLHDRRSRSLFESPLANSNDTPSWQKNRYSIGLLLHST